MTESVSRTRRGESPGRRKTDGISMGPSATADSILIAEFGQRVLTQTDLASVMSDAVSLVSRRLNTEYVKVLELASSGDGFLLTAGVGWRQGYVGQVVVPLRPDSHAGYTLKAGVSILVEDIHTETRFGGDPILHEHGIVSGIAAVLRGRERVYGVLTVHTAERRKFAADEVVSLESVAGILAAAMDRREMEAALRESNERLHLAMDAGRMGTWDWNPHTGAVIWSETLEKMHGFEPGTFPATSQAFFALIHPDDRERVQLMIGRSLQKGIHEMEYRALLDDGSVRWLSTRGVVVKDARGEAARMIGVCLDITDRKAGEMRLVAQHAVARALAETHSVVEATSGVLQAICQELDWALGQFWIVDRRLGRLACRNNFKCTSRDTLYLQELSRETTLEIGIGLPGRVWQSGRPEWIEDIHVDRNFPRFGAVTTDGLRSGFGFPIVLDGEVIGVIEFFSTERRKADASLLEAMASIGSQVGQFIERKRGDDERESLLAQLESTRDRVDNLVANVPGVVWEAWGEPDAATQRIDFVSDYVETMLGYTVEEWVTTPNFWLTIVHPNDKEKAAAAASATFEMGGGTNEFRWVAKDGRVIWVEAQSTVITDEDGNPVGMRGVTIDITERRLAEARIRETEERFSKAFHASPAGLSIVSAKERRFIDVNDSFLSIVGYSREEVVGKLVDEVGVWILPEEREKFARSLTEGEGHARNVEVQLRTRDGDLRSVLGSAEQITLGGESCVLALMYDMTERKQAEAAERTARAEAEAAVRRQSFLAEASAILSSSLDFEETLASLARLCVPFLADWCAVDVLDGSELRRVAVVHADPAKVEFARQLQERYPPDPESPELRQVLAGQSVHLAEITDEFMHKAAQDVESLKIIRNLGLSSAIGVALKASGRTLGVLTLVTAESGRTYTPADLALAEDVGQRAGLAVENAMLYRVSQEVQKELRRANEAKDEFLGLVSHELRTPITTIYGGARLLRTRGVNIDEESQISVLEDIEHESERLHRIVEDLLVLARVELGEEIATEPVLLQRTVEKSVNTFKRHRPGREFVVQLDDEMAPVRASNVYLEQILRNLMNNADKYSPPETAIEIVSYMQDGDAVISVMDRGPGIPPEEVDLIFERFYRSHGTAKQAGGAGIGLTVCKRLVEAQNGRIWAEPREGGGLIVSFSLPRYTDKPE